MTKLPALIVDDSAFDRVLLVKALAFKGNLEIIEADCGERSLEILETQPVGIVLLDFMMPGLSGFEVLQRIRSKFNAVELPVIMITGRTDDADVVSCLQNGANDYITKPVNFEVAMTRISTHLTLAQLSREMSRLKEKAALDAMITTYNHEINNPLTIALGCVNGSLLADEAAVRKLRSSLWRVAEIVKKIRSITEQQQAEFEDYGELSKMIKLR